MLLDKKSSIIFFLGENLHLPTFVLESWNHDNSETRVYRCKLYDYAAPFKYTELWVNEHISIVLCKRILFSIVDIQWQVYKQNSNQISSQLWFGPIVWFRIVLNEYQQ